ncbi:MAG TPA: tRNA pseudouridine(55) synthase TruB [Polyangiaceae bacterium]|nr:tRNA pseudouridine(55) synthase TruB [Polyangiaceae bacterium]
MLGHLAPSGVLIIDKPSGLTSHDVVARVRKALATRAVGHAGTLDPAATGVLVVLVGEATKLAPYLTQQDKTYDATVTFGTSTTTLDAEGDVVARAPLPDELVREPRAAIERALAIERERTEQIPPAFSAIKLAGRPAYERARRGEEVPLVARSVRIVDARVVAMAKETVTLSLRVSKGYYVRSFARDLGATLGVPSHLSVLRRVASGLFTLAEALPLSSSGEELLGALLPVEDAARRVLAAAELSAEGAFRAVRGQPLVAEHFTVAPPAGSSAWFNRAGELVAVGRATEQGFAVERGFAHSTSNDAT